MLKSRFIVRLSFPFSIYPVLTGFWLILFGCASEGYRPLPKGTMLFPSSPPVVQADSIEADDYPIEAYGTLISSGSDTISRYGFCYSSYQKTPTTSDSIAEIAGPVREFPSRFHISIRSLKPNLLYYARAFAQNKQGIAYSETVITFVSPDTRTIPTVTTDTVENVTGTSANMKAAMTSDGGAAVSAYGFCLSNNDATPEMDDQVVIAGTMAQQIPLAFAEVVTGLSNNTLYYVRAFATNVKGTAFGPVLTFRTTPAPVVLPTVATDNVLNIATTTATVEGTFSGKGSGDITRYGFCYSSSKTNPTVSDIVVISGTTTPPSFPHAFLSNLSGLIANTNYYVRAFATTNAGTSYGVSRSFKTTAVATVAPTVVTNTIAGITTNSATANGMLQNGGTSPITKYGFCFSTNRQNPTTSDQVIAVGTTPPARLPQSFNAELSRLDASTTYYLRAFATSAVGTSYGASISFTTLSPPTAPPAVQTVNVSAVSYFSGSVLGNITSPGTSALIEYGVVLSSTNNAPTISDIKVVSGTSSPARFPAAYTTTVSRLTPATTYYVRAYATSSVATSYGAMQRLVTTAAIPIVVTDQVNFDIGSNTTTARGTIQNKGAADIVRYGFCYSPTNSMPTVADNFTALLTSIRTFPYSFSQNFPRLNPGIYYFRTYAENSFGIAYGNVSRVTVYSLPGISTETSTTKNNEQGIETLSGSITSAGSAPVTEYGFCYLPTSLAGPNFRVGDPNVAIVQRSSPLPGRFPYPYSIDVTVSYNQDYSYRAYVRTSNGYAYGTIKTFYINFKP